MEIISSKNFEFTITLLSHIHYNMALNEVLHIIMKVSHHIIDIDCAPKDIRGNRWEYDSGHHHVKPCFVLSWLL